MTANELSNKEIARALFVTVKTVEQPPGPVYRELEIVRVDSSVQQLGAPVDAATAS
jgi:DNA-binding CsgD family transcriptional regulator